MLPLRSHGWFVLTEPLPTKASRYHSAEDQRTHPESLPVGTLVMSRVENHKNVDGSGQQGQSLLLMPVRGVESTGGAGNRDEWLVFDQARTAWRRWCDRDATVQHQKRFDDPTPVLGTTAVPVRPATALDVQPLFDQVQAARQRALDRHRYDDLEHYNRDVHTVIAGLSSDEQARLRFTPDASPRHRWEASGLNSRRFEVRQAREHGDLAWVPATPTTPRSQAARPIVLNPDDDANSLLKKHRHLMAWIDRVSPRVAQDWFDEAVVSALSHGGAVATTLRDADRSLGKLPPLDKPVWTLAEQERRNRLIERTAQALRPWAADLVRNGLIDPDERLVAATTLNQPGEPPSSAWNGQGLEAFQREVASVVAEALLWERKVEIDLQTIMQARPAASAHVRAPSTPR